jgi:hypothetical protein
LKAVVAGVEERENGGREGVPKVEGAAKLKLVTMQNARADATVTSARNDLIGISPSARDG